MRAIRVVGAGIGAAVGTGVLVGGLSRVLMRLVSIASGAAGEFSWGGSLSIVLVYAVAMLPGALVAAATTRVARWFVAAAGSVFLCFPAVGVASEDIGNRAGWSVFRWVAVITASIAVLATIAVAPIVAVRLADRLMGRERPAPYAPASAREAGPVRASAR
jgi:hypothetical protein